jgi:hypothetical protein
MVLRLNGEHDLPPNRRLEAVGRSYLHQFVQAQPGWACET